MFVGATGRGVLVLGGVLAAACFAGSDARAAGGKVTIASTPPGASVYLDNEVERRGETPLEITGIAAGMHKIRVSLPGRADQRRGFYLTDGGKREFSFTLRAAGEEAPKRVTPRRDPKPDPKPEPREDPSEREKKEKIPKTIDVECPFCRGSKVMDKMGCFTCKSTGYIDINSCSKCEGSRRIDYACPFCAGKGVLASGGKERDCPKCRGEGNLPCPPCRGAGTIRRANPEAARYTTADCPYCNATGFLPEAKCTYCGGDGEMWIGRSDTTTNQGGGGGVLGRSGGRYGTRRQVSCPYCGGEGKGAPLCRRCQGRGFQGYGRTGRPCSSCFGTGLSFIPCRGCSGRAYVKARK